MRYTAVVLLFIFGACGKPSSTADARRSASASDAGQVWVPEGPLMLDGCVSTMRTKMNGCSPEVTEGFEACVDSARPVARIMCKGEHARYGGTLRPVRYGDLGGCIDSWTVDHSRDCCQQVKCNAP